MICPICRKQIGQDTQYVPFCSERCKLIDLGNWATGKYVITSPIAPEADDESEKEDGAE